ncbi:hypothetical protein B0H13DRAFT_2374232 [Mycena leptocephala]|nr:hypothetical protein B0H13DRAFT_2374232 [Mycena leptocephala]
MSIDRWAPASCPAPSTTLPTKTSLAAPPPALARPPNCPKDRMPATQIQIHIEGYHPHPNQYQRPPAPAYHPHPHPHPHPQQQQYAPQYGEGYPGEPAAPSIRAPSLRPTYHPRVSAPAPDRPTDAQGLMAAQAAMSQQGKHGHQWRRSASPAPPPSHSHASLQSGPPALSYWRRGGTGH